MSRNNIPQVIPGQFAQTNSKDPMALLMDLCESQKMIIKRLDDVIKNNQAFQLAVESHNSQIKDLQVSNLELKNEVSALKEENYNLKQQVFENKSSTADNMLSIDYLSQCRIDKDIFCLVFPKK
jgi:predicted nuclease with TOPRIM domain